MNLQKILFGIIGVLFFLVVVNIVIMNENPPSQETENTLDDTGYKKINYKYTGESEHWKGEYILEGEEITYESFGVLEQEYWHEGTGHVEYIGDISKLNAAEKLDIKAEFGSSSSSMGVTFDNDAPRETVFNLPVDSSDVFGVFENPIELKLILDGETEVLQLVPEDISK
ncbi:hypothetical protein SAMN05216389_10840 [Oceanobacillus limi]|uniref:Uncharacterized protein n=1 Tax=Oceanobacillus limi TaxID=930131 RepID=A0A1I0D894_9BACI|nr:hypothetical protein [Oceanobacillus limi]SET27872.1 hypothetical protein SAMN05216389_10840 [Oceanobacillus limi]